MKRNIITIIALAVAAMMATGQEVVRYTIVDSDMSTDGQENLYTIKADQMPAGTKIDFLDGTTSKGTIMYQVESTWYSAYTIDENNKVVPYEASTSETEQTFYFKLPESWSDAVPNIHIYHTLGDTDITDVNSTAMTKREGYDDWYYYTFTNRGAETYYVMFNINNWGEKTEPPYSINDTNDHYLTVTENSTVAELEQMPVRIYFKRPDNFTFIPHVHVYIYIGGTVDTDRTDVNNQNMTPWAGHEDWFYYEYNHTGDEYCVIFNDHGWENAGGQTENYTVTTKEDVYFTYDNGSAIETTAPTTTDSYATIRLSNLPDSWDVNDDSPDADITTIQLYNTTGSNAGNGTVPEESTLDATTLDEMSPDGEGGYYYYLYGNRSKYKFQIAEANVNNQDNWNGATPATTYFSPAYNSDSPAEADYYISSDNYVFVSDTTDIKTIESNKEGEAEYFNLQGMKISPENLDTGLYIVRQNGTTKKILIKQP